MSGQVFFFGCWNRPGHYLFEPGGYSPSNRDVSTYGDDVHIDGSLAPRRRLRTGLLCWSGQGKTREERDRIQCDSVECPQGQFVLHQLDNGFTAIQWWDRCQGDTRGACNSTVLLAGKRTGDEMLDALREHFPHVVENLVKNQVCLMELKP